MQKLSRCISFCIFFLSPLELLAQACTVSLVTPTTLANGISVTSVASGSIVMAPTQFTSCGNITTHANSMRVGANGAFTYTVYFSELVNDLQVNITATGAENNEDFIFSTDEGSPSIFAISSCYSAISGNIINSGVDAVDITGGGAFVISTPCGFKSISVMGSGGSGGSYLSVCRNSIMPFLYPDELLLINSENNVSNLSTPIINVRHRQAKNNITATNLVTVGDNIFQNGVIYRAGKEIILGEGFEAVFGAQFAAYIDECPDPFLYRPLKSALITLSNDEGANSKDALMVFPNPVDGNIQVSAGHNKLRNITVYSAEGKLMQNIVAEGSSSLTINVINYAKGIYFIKAFLQDGQTHTKKIIKN